MFFKIYFQETKIEDTVHYMSLATTPAVTEFEGDFLYQQYIAFQDELVTNPADYTSTSRTSTSISCDEVELQRTLAIIKPEALKFKDVIIRAIKEAGLKIISVSIQLIRYF